MAKTVYFIDTSSIIHIYDTYPPTFLASLWDKLDEFVKTGRLLSSEMVLDEISPNNKVLHAWAIKHRSIFVPVDQEQLTKSQEIGTRFRKLIDTKKDKPQADPFLIALAVVEQNKPKLHEEDRVHAIVVSEENEGTPEKPKIPLVCRAYKVECIKVLDMFHKEGWKF